MPEQYGQILILEVDSTIKITQTVYPYKTYMSYS